MLCAAFFVGKKRWSPRALAHRPTRHTLWHTARQQADVSNWLTGHTVVTAARTRTRRLASNGLRHTKISKHPLRAYTPQRSTVRMYHPLLAHASVRNFVRLALAAFAGVRHGKNNLRWTTGLVQRTGQSPTLAVRRKQSSGR